jgi:hypothetical protein
VKERPLLRVYAILSWGGGRKAGFAWVGMDQILNSRIYKKKKYTHTQIPHYLFGAMMMESIQVKKEHFMRVLSLFIQ